MKFLVIICLIIILSAPADCPTNEVFSCSAYVCQPTCADPKAEKCAECNRMLGVRKACICANGLIRLYDYGPCVSPRKCSYISPAPGPVISAY